MPIHDSNPPSIVPNNIRDMIDNVKISSVWAALGGGRIWGNRGSAFWRGGDGLSVNLNDAKGAFYDHVAGAGGGILDLICLVRGCTRSDALRWLCNLTGTPHHQVDRQGREHWKRRATAAAAEASEFTAWKHSTERALRCHRAAVCGRYHDAKIWLIKHESEIDTEPWAAMMRIQNYSWAEFERYEAEVEAFRKAAPVDLLARFRREVTVKVNPAYLEPNSILDRDVWDLRRDLLLSRRRPGSWSYFEDNESVGGALADSIQFRHQQRIAGNAETRGKL